MLRYFTINCIVIAWQRNYFLKHFNVDLFMRLHLETNSSRVLSVDEGSALAIITFSVKKVTFFCAAKYACICKGIER